ncbi:MAG: TrkH family potassium uptake protein [Planctomycetes bacterium]|nr:TrkH family potassium uptake protein [Planctomycetota bacterium]
MNKTALANVLGRLILLIGAFMVIPLAIEFHCARYALTRPVLSFLAAIALSALAGVGMVKRFKKQDEAVGVREGFAVVSLGWITVAFFGSLPFAFSGLFGSFTDCYFETMSGFSTTGATILTRTKTLPNAIESLGEIAPGLLFWRSMTHWLGGMGIVLLTVAILPALGVGGYQMFKAEVPGVTAEKITPRVAQTAKLLWGIYILFSVAETLLLWPKMPLYDALCHTFGTMATGGFSTKNASIAYYHSVYVDVVIMIFMFFAGCSFVLHWHVLHGRPMMMLRNKEFQFFVGLLVLATVLITISLSVSPLHNPGNLYSADNLTEEAARLTSLGARVRQALFQVLAATTTTGYCTSNFDVWPTFCGLLLVAMMFVGGCAGSTGGGMKVRRIMLLIKAGLREIRKVTKPSAVIPIKIGDEVTDESIMSSILAFFVLFMLSLVGASIVMALMGLDVVTAVTSVVATLNNIGPGLAKVGAIQNYSHIPTLGKWVLIFCMLLGRLELFSVLILFSPATWRR